MRRERDNRTGTDDCCHVACPQQAKLLDLVRRGEILKRLVLEVPEHLLVDIKILSAKWKANMSGWLARIKESTRVAFGFDSKRLGRYSGGLRVIGLCGPGNHSKFGGISKATLLTQSEFDKSVGPTSEHLERARRWIGREVERRVSIASQPARQTVPRSGTSTDVPSSAARGGNPATPSSAGRARKEPASIALRAHDGVSRSYLLHEWQMAQREVRRMEASLAGAEASLAAAEAQRDAAEAQRDAAEAQRDAALSQLEDVCTLLDKEQRERGEDVQKAARAENVQKAAADLAIEAALDRGRDEPAAQHKAKIDGMLRGASSRPMLMQAKMSEMESHSKFGAYAEGFFPSSFRIGRTDRYAGRLSLDKPDTPEVGHCAVITCPVFRWT